MTYRGFTLIEVLVTSAIAVMITGFLVTNFNRSRNELAATAPSIIGDIRRAQSFAIAGSQFDDSYRCGFGIIFEEDAYELYAGPVAGTCGAIGYDEKMRTTGELIERVELNNLLEFKAIGDIYFVPPLPYTYLNGLRAADTESITISIGTRGKACSPSTCRSFRIDRSGQVTTVNPNEE